MKKKSNWLNLTALSLLLITTGVSAQNLIISTAGQTGTSGTNWSTSGSSPVIITATGTANINPSVITGYLNAGTSVRVLNNNGAIDVANPIQKTNGASATLTLGAGGNLSLSAAISATTNALNIVLASEIDRLTTPFGTAGLGVKLNTISTNGGSLWVGGGAMSGSWNGLTVGSGHAMGGASNQIGVEGAGTITTGGGSIRILGDTNAGGILNTGIGAYGGDLTLNSGTGTIELFTNIFDFRYENSSSNLYIVSTGGLVVAPISASFNSDVTWDGGLNGSNYVSTNTNPGSFNGLIIPNTLSSFTIGKPSNTTRIIFNTDIAVNGGIALYGGTFEGIELNGNITSNGLGDLLFQGTETANSGWSVRLATGKTISKTSGTGNIYINGTGRINLDGNVTASGTANPNVVIVAETDNQSFFGVGVSTINTNGGNLWIGGGALTSTWKGLPVGNGSAFGRNTGGNLNAIDIFGNIVTSGGDVYMSGYSVDSGADIGARTANSSINAGSGNIVLLTYANRFVDNTGNKLRLTSTGSLTLAPITGNTFNLASLTFNGSIASNTFTGLDDATGLLINDFSNLGGLVLGSYLGSGVGGDTPYSFANTSSTYIQSNVAIAGPITAFGGEIIIGSGANLTTTTANNINLIASNGFTTAGTTRTTINSNGGNILIAADADANNTGQLNLDYLTLDAGTGNLTIEGSTMSWDVATNTYPILKGTGALTIQSNGASFGQVVDLQWFALEGVKSSFTFGKTSNVTALTTNNCTSCASSSDNFTGKTLSVTGPIAVFGSTLAINSALTATNSNITLGATTAITQTAAITANGLALIGAGAATLTNAGNSINTIAGGTSSVRIGALNFNNNKALTVGTVGTAGIFSTAAIELATSSGDVILTEPVNSTLASGDAVKLFADKDALAGAVGDGNIKFSGNGAVTIASGARALLYSGTETASTGLTTAIGGIANYRYNVANNTVLGSIVPAIDTTGRFGLLRTTANADLSALAVSVGTLSPTFAAATIAYTASVSNETTSIMVTPTRSDANATITVNGTAVTSGNTSGAINLTVGANTITTIVTAQSGTTTNTYTITVTRRQTQTITFSALSVATFNDADIVPGATSSSGLTVNYASSNTAVATIVSGNIRVVGAGSAVITASQIGNASFDAATDVQRTLTVNKGTATLTLSNLTPTYDGTAKSATITTSPAGLSGVAITYAGSATAPTAAGTYAVIASLTNNNYTATNATGSLVIGKAIQTITFPALASKTTSDVDYEPGATVNSGLALRYTSSNTAVATVYQDAADGNKWKISIQGSGTTDITAIQDGNSDYNSASFLRALPVGTSLPVTVVSYDAKLNTNGTVQLTWLTASETNNSYFELQRSTDGITFTTIGKVTGAGNSTQEKRYDFIDLSPLAGTNYYKLLQYDKDGKKTDLGVRSVKVLLKENELTVYPNPSNGIVNVSFDINSYQKVELVDLTGKILMTKTIGRQASTISFDISDLSAGVYNIRLTGERKLAIKQIVKH
jgi:hypothetical protein